MKKTGLLLFAFAVLLISCHSGEQSKKSMTNPPKHVIIVGFDGFSSYSLNNGADMPNLRRIMEKGAYTLESRSVLPSSSAVNWASMFMGAGPELHGYTTWGSKTPELPSRELNKNGMFPGIFGLVRDKYPDAETGYIHEWDGIKYLIDTLAVNFRLQTTPTPENPDVTLITAKQYIEEKKPALFAAIFDEPDHTGHAHGWESPEYFAQLTRLDSCLGEIIKSIEKAGIMDETIIIVVSDHGGINKGHGGKTMKEMQAPVVFYGKGVKEGHKITESTMIYDIAATIAYMFGVERPQVWIARPINF